MNAEEKWQEARNILNNNPSESDRQKAIDLLQEAIAENHAGANFTMAMLYFMGIGFEIDKKKAFEYAQKSHALGFERSKLMLAIYLTEGEYIEKDLAKAERYLRDLAEKGDVEACAQLAQFIFNDTFPTEDKKEGTAWLRKAAESGYPIAMYQLGRLYQYGDGVEQNIEVASDWWLKAAMKGYIPACHDLGIYYVFTKHDIEKGLRWLDESAEAGYVPSYRVLGDIYFNGWGVEADVEKGIDYLTKAAEQDYEDAQIQLATIYHDGDHVEKDFQKAKYWFEKYLAHDSAEAHYRMGRCLFEGDMYDQDYAKALEHITKAVKNGCHDASPYYINLLWDGNHVTKNQEEVLATFKELADNNDGVAAYYLFILYEEETEYKDLEKAISYLKQSAATGYDEALSEMGRQYLDDGLFDTDLKKANEYFAQASELGNAVAMVNLANSYRSGREVEKDIKKALELYTHAAQAGEPYGAKEAARIYMKGEDNVVDVNYDKAIELLQHYADKDPDACYLLSFAMNAKSELKNCYSWELVEKAFGYMFQAAKAGNPDAIFRVGYAFMEGRGVIIDMALAKLFFENALKKGHRVDDVNDILSKYFSGDGDAELYPRYVYWHGIAENNPARVLEKEPLLDEDGAMLPMAVVRGAAQCGEVNAESLLGTSLLSEDPDKAKKYITAVVKQGYADIAEYVGKLYYDGNEIEQNHSKAEEYFRLGVEAGHIGCALSLGLMYTAEGVSAETEKCGIELLQAVCDSTEESSDLYKHAFSQLKRIEGRNSSVWKKISNGLKSLFGNN